MRAWLSPFVSSRMWRLMILVFSCSQSLLPTVGYHKCSYFALFFVISDALDSSGFRTFDFESQIYPGGSRHLGRVIIAFLDPPSHQPVSQNW